MRFPILMSPMWRPLLLPFGGTPERSYAEIQDGELHVRFGWLFDQRFPLTAIEGASPSHWSVWAGIGWRTNFRGTVGLIGTYVNTVEVRFREPQRVRMVLPFACRRLFVSLEDPREFINALRQAVTPQPPRQPVGAGAGTNSRPRRRKKNG